MTANERLAHHQTHSAPVMSALKLAIRTRKNAMFHKSMHGTHVASLLLSLIATCELANKNPVQYLIALQELKSDVFKHRKNIKLFGMWWTKANKSQPKIDSFTLSH